MKCNCEQIYWYGEHTHDAVFPLPRASFQVLAKSGKALDYASKQANEDEEELVDPKDAGKIRDRQESR